MKKRIVISRQLFPGAATLLLFAAMLLAPRQVFTGAQEGLLLWFQIVIPTLFPFMLISNLLLEYRGLELISRIFGRVMGRIFAVSGNGTFAVLAGFLCGYPMGAKVTADLVRAGRITEREGSYLLGFCNNTSPVFIMNFVIWKTLGEESLLIPSLLILLGTPALFSFMIRPFYLRGSRRFSIPGPEIPDRGPSPDADRKKGGASGFDHCMMNAFEGIVKVGGYIIFFSILLRLLNAVPGQYRFLTVFAPSLEITNGILILSRTVDNSALSYSLIMGLTAFGGFCSVAQTQCMIRGTGLKIFPYGMQKLAAGTAASLLAYLYMIVFAV